MPNVVGVRFGQATKIYYFDPTEFETLEVGDYVIVDTARGRELGKIATAPHYVPKEDIVGKLKKVLRLAEAWDLVQSESFGDKEREALAICTEKVAEQKLPMKLVRAEYSFDGSRLTFFFSAEKRVDFRALVRELAKTFRTRIELRQIGVRDEAKLIGGIGHCGRPLCCSSWLCEFNPVSIKMAKQQDLPLNPMEISGVCGRLLCCLSYENEFYTAAKKRLPKVGRTVTTPQGKGKVVGLDVFAETIKIRLENDVLIEITIDELEGKMPNGLPESTSTSLPARQRPEPTASQPRSKQPTARSASNQQPSESSKSRRKRRRGKKLKRSSRDT